MNMGGPDMAPKPPSARSAPAEPGTLLDIPHNRYGLFLSGVLV